MSLQCTGSHTDCMLINSSAMHRAREKINKPLLRNRRRGNDLDSLHKLQTIRQNQLDAIKFVHFLIKRERKKRDIVVRSQLLCNALLSVHSELAQQCRQNLPVCPRQHIMSHIVSAALHAHHKCALSRHDMNTGMNTGLSC